MRHTLTRALRLLDWHRERRDRAHGDSLDQLLVDHASTDGGW